MPDTKISALSAATTLAGTETLPVVQGGATVAATVTQVLAASLDLAGTKSMTGALASTVGTFTSSVANGAAAKGFTLNTPSYTTAGAKLLSLANNSVEKFSVTKDGNIFVPITASLAQVIGSGTAAGDAAIWADTSKFYFLNGNNTGYVQVGTGALSINGAATATLGFVHGTTGGLQSNINNGWALLNSSLTASVNCTAAKLCVTGATLTYDTFWERGASGRMDATDGAGNRRDVGVRNLFAGGGNGSYIQTPSMTVANLAAAATAGAGARAFVTDATATTFLSTVAGGGANKVPVVSDGTNWLIG